MKILKNVIVGVVVLSVSLALFTYRPVAARAATAQIHESADFYAPLAPCGAWIDVAGYGRCFRPAGVAMEWQPYCDGDWVWTDCGWYWDSDAPWAWACYHYGTWVIDPGYGWVWVPGIEWAPAWVEWRVGGGYIGWAPCAPRGAVVAPGVFAFVDVNHFNDPIRMGALAFNNETILRQTTKLADPQRETRTIDGVAQTVVVNHGPGVEGVEKATGRQISALSVADEMRRTPMPAALRPVQRTSEPVATPASPERFIAPNSDTGPARDPGSRPLERPTPPVIPAERPAAQPHGNSNSGGGAPRDGDHGGSRNDGGDHGGGGGRARNGGF